MNATVWHQTDIERGHGSQLQDPTAEIAASKGLHDAHDRVRVHETRGLLREEQSLAGSDHARAEGKGPVRA